MADSLGVPKEEFLASARRALGRVPGQAPTPYPRLQDTGADLAQQAEALRKRVAANLPALLERLAQTAQLRGWNIRRAADAEAAVSYVVELARRLQANRVVRSAQDVFQAVELDAPLRALGLAVTPIVQGDERSREALRQEIAVADMGVTGADLAVAETGSVVVLPRRGLSRLVSLYPPVHVALVRPQDVVESLDDVFALRRLAYWQNGGDMGSYQNFITGPSRTADIEQTIVIGVHGPKEVHLVLLG